MIGCKPSRRMGVAVRPNTYFAFVLFRMASKEARVGCAEERSASFDEESWANEADTMTNYRRAYIPGAT